MVVSTVGGQVSQSFNLKGINSTLVDGMTAGLHALAHAYEVLWQTDDQDALVVVAADEIGPLFYRLFDRLGLLTGPDASVGEQLAPYDPQAGGMILGEGAVALVLERRRHAQKRSARAYAQLAGVGLTTDAYQLGKSEPEGKWLTRAMEAALTEAGLGAAEMDVAYGHGRGLPASDAREVRAWQRLLAGRATPLCCVSGHTGVAEATAGLYSVAAALLGMQRGEAYPVLTAGSLPKELTFVQGQVQRGQYRTALVAGSTEQGNNAAVVLRQV
jgi:3-oxoacyl-[acyl-carrier-protein] synthase II